MLINTDDSVMESRDVSMCVSVSKISGLVSASKFASGLEGCGLVYITDGRSS